MPRASGTPACTSSGWRTRRGSTTCASPRRSTSSRCCTTRERRSPTAIPTFPRSMRRGWSCTGSPAARRASAPPTAWSSSPTTRSSTTGWWCARRSSSSTPATRSVARAASTSPGCSHEPQAPHHARVSQGLRRDARAAVPACQGCVAGADRPAVRRDRGGGPGTRAGAVPAREGAEPGQALGTRHQGDGGSARARPGVPGGLMGRRLGGALAGGALGGALVGGIEALAAWWHAHGAGEVPAVAWALAIYGAVGGCVGIGAGIAAALLQTDGFALAFAGTLAGLGFVVARFRIVRDVVLEQMPQGPLPTAVQAAALLATAILAGALWRGLRGADRRMVSRPLAAIAAILAMAGVSRGVLPLLSKPQVTSAVAVGTAQPGVPNV